MNMYIGYFQTSEGKFIKDLIFTADENNSENFNASKELEVEKKIKRLTTSLDCLKKNNQFDKSRR